MENRLRSYVYIHVSVFLFGFTGILGQLISLSAVHLIFWRCLLSSVIMLPLFWFSSPRAWPTGGNLLRFIGIGLLLGMHWLCFYGSIKLSNASVAMICLSMISVMTVFFEALFNRTRLVMQDLLIGMLVIPGILLINQSLKADFRTGFWVGILCAVLSAMVAPLNKRNLRHAEPLTISWIEITVAALLFFGVAAGSCAFFDGTWVWPSSTDWMLLLLLASFCTVIPLSLSLASMKHLSAFSTMLVFNLETVYGIILSIVVLKEHRQLNAQFYLGVLLILASVFVYPFLKRRGTV